MSIAVSLSALFPFLFQITDSWYDKCRKEGMRVNRKKLLLVAEAAVCVALAVFLAASAIGILRDGLARQAENPRESIYTPEAVAQKLCAAAPLVWAFLALLIAGLATGPRDERASKPAPGATRLRQATARPSPTPGAAGTRAKRTALLIAAVVLIIAGIFNGSALDVLGKAITICSECVGLG